MAISFNFSPALAQEEPGPTPTPSTPVWLAFSVLRDAIEEEHGVNLTLVRRYDWQQEEYTISIDTCQTLDDPNAARPVYFGWTFTITDLANRVYQGRVSFDLDYSKSGRISRIAPTAFSVRLALDDLDKVLDLNT